MAGWKADPLGKRRAEPMAAHSVAKKAVPKAGSKADLSVGRTDKTWAGPKVGPMVDLWVDMRADSKAEN